MTEAAWNIHMQVFSVEVSFQIIRINIWKSDCWILWVDSVWLCKNLNLFSQLAISVWISISNERVPLVPHFHQWLILSGIFPSACSHSSRCVVVSYRCFNFHFPNDKWSWTSFLMFICHLHIFRCVISIQVICPFGVFLFSYCWILSSVYIADTNPLSDKWFASIFSWSVTCLSFSWQWHSQSKSF